MPADELAPDLRALPSKQTYFHQTDPQGALTHDRYPVGPE